MKTIIVIAGIMLATVACDFKIPASPTESEIRATAVKVVGRHYPGAHITTIQPEKEDDGYEYKIVFTLNGATNVAEVDCTFSNFCELDD